VVVGTSGPDPRTVPVQTVTLSEFHIDVDLVTKARYEACATDGACARPPAESVYTNLTADEVVSGITWSDARAFCVWDGGRLPTEFEWEKAARGAAPDMRILVSGTFAGLRLVYSPSMTYAAAGLSGYTGESSPWGVRQIASGVTEYTTSYLTDSLGTLPSRDPATAAGSTDQRATRGAPFMEVGRTFVVGISVFPRPWGGGTVPFRGGVAESSAPTPEVSALNAMPSRVPVPPAFRCVR